MKKKIIILMTVIVVLSFTSCGKKAEAPVAIPIPTEVGVISLDTVESKPLEWVEEQLDDCTKEQLHKAWGEPASSMELTPEITSEMWYLSDGVKYVVVFFENDDGTVDDIVIEE